MTLKEEINWLSKRIKTELKSSEDVIVFRSILARLRKLDAKDPPSPFHSQAIGVYKEWLTAQGLPGVVDARDAKAMKDILTKLKEASNDKTDESAFAGFLAVLKYWNRVGDYLSRRKQLTQINHNLLEIIDKIKNGSTKQSANALEAESLHDSIARKYSTNNS